MTNQIETARASVLAEYQAMRDNLNAYNLDEVNANMAETLLKEIDTLIEKDQLMTVDGRINAIYNLIMSRVEDDNDR